MNRRPQLFGKTLFVDLMMSTLVVVTALLIASNAVERDQRKQQAVEAAKLKTEGAFAVVMSWPDDSPDDVDLYVQDPDGKIAYFDSRDVGLMHLEHDDQGSVSDRIKSSHGEIKVEKNEERTILRGTIPGEYIVNVHMYDKRSGSPTPVTISLYRLKGEDEEMVKKVRVLPNKGDEATAFRFTVAVDGSVRDINELERSIIRGIPQGQRSSTPRFPGGF